MQRRRLRGRARGSRYRIDSRQVDALRLSLSLALSLVVCSLLVLEVVIVIMAMIVFTFAVARLLHQRWMEVCVSVGRRGPEEQRCQRGSRDCGLGGVSSGLRLGDRASGGRRVAMLWTEKEESASLIL